MPVLSDDEYAEYLALKGGEDHGDGDPREAFFKDLDAVPDGDPAAVRAVFEKHSPVDAEDDPDAKHGRAGRR